MFIQFTSVYFPQRCILYDNYNHFGCSILIGHHSQHMRDTNVYLFRDVFKFSNV